MASVVLPGTVEYVLARGVLCVPRRIITSKSSSDFESLLWAICSSSSGEKGSDTPVRRLILRVGPWRRERRSSFEDFWRRGRGLGAGVVGERGATGRVGVVVRREKVRVMLWFRRREVTRERRPRMESVFRIGGEVKGSRLGRVRGVEESGSGDIGGVSKC